MRPDQRERPIGGAVPKSRRRRRRTALVLVAGAALFFGCSSDGDGPLSSVELPAAGPGDSAPVENAPSAPDQPVETSPPEQPVETSPPEQPPAEQPAPEQPAPEEPAPDSSDGGLTGGEWALIVLVGLLVVGVIAVIASLASRRSGGASTVATPEQSRLDSVLRNGRFFHDSTSLTLLQPRDAVGLQSLWNTGDRELVELQSQVGALVAVVTDPVALSTLRALGDALSGLRGALEANVRLRVSGQGSEQTAVIEASTQTALARRAELDRALQQASSLRL